MQSKTNNTTIGMNFFVSELWLSLALLKNDKIIAHYSSSECMMYAEQLLTLFRNTCTNINIVNFFSICSGPGSFTSIRILFSFLKGLNIPLSKQVISLSRFEIQAWSFYQENCENRKEKTIVIVQKARLNQYYMQAFFWNKELEDIECICPMTVHPLSFLDDFIKTLIKSIKRDQLYLMNLSSSDSENLTQNIPTVTSVGIPININATHLGKLAFQRLLDTNKKQSHKFSQSYMTPYMPLYISPPYVKQGFS